MVRAVVTAVAVLTLSGCFAELTAGPGFASGGAGGVGFSVGVVAGVNYDFGSAVRVGWLVSSAATRPSRTRRRSFTTIAG